MPLRIAGTLALYLTMREKGISDNEFARRLAVRETVVRRMLAPDHDTMSEELQATSEALGKSVIIHLEDAA